jgi:diacylglycerol kinase family enzyme
VRLIANSNYDEIAGIANVAVANGRWFSGGLRVAPQAEPGDGVFDIVVMGGKPRRRIVQTLQSLRTGAHLDDPAVRVVRASRLVAAPTVETNGAVAVETDGESAGLLPATFEILPSAINLRC